MPPEQNLHHFPSGSRGLDKTQSFIYMIFDLFQTKRKFQKFDATYFEKRRLVTGGGIVSIRLLMNLKKGIRTLNF